MKRLSSSIARLRPVVVRRSWRASSTAVTAEDEELTLHNTDYNVATTLRGPRACDSIGLSDLKITKPETIFRNLTYSELYDHELANREGVVAHTKYGPTFAVDTGKFTGRSPTDKYVVKHIGARSEKEVWWGTVNQPMSPTVFDDVMDKAVDYMNTLDSLYVTDLYCGGGLASRHKVRFVHELAWQSHFVTNMFVRPEKPSELASFGPSNIDMTVINACAIGNDDYQRHGLNSEVCVAFDFERKLAVVLGSWYGGENKKGIFSLMNYELPLAGVMPMHCSANVGDAGDVALFFGLSGTGKTTLSADRRRHLIGDDEHGWDDDGIFNFEGGCYAKTLNLSEAAEPEIYAAIRTDALLENVFIDHGKPDYYDARKTQNGRVSYPIPHIPNYYAPQKAGHPTNVIFLTCDAFGVLPPVSKLDPDRAMYHFLSGYTAKVAGTERGVVEPTATFSACFGEAFLTLHPLRYAELLREKLDKHGSNVYLVNTGWSGGGYGVGQRMPITVTRACVDAILDGSIESAAFVEEPVFGMEMPTALPGVPEGVLQPREAWSNKKAYDTALHNLARMYAINFERYEGQGADYSQFGPNVTMNAAQRRHIQRLVTSQK